MQTHHFCPKFNAANIVFPCFWMNTTRNYVFLRIWSLKGLSVVTALHGVKVYSSQTRNMECSGLVVELMT